MSPNMQHPAGPSPLPLHLGLAGTIWLNWPLLWQRLQIASPGSKPLWSPSLQQKAASLAAASAELPPEIWSQALAAEGLRRYGQYMAGLKTYRAQPVADEAYPTVLLQQSGSSRLLDYAPGQDRRVPALLVIPSLVNRPDILDLGEEHGLLRWLAQQGIRPLLVDWGRPDAAEQHLTLADYIGRLQQFLETARQKTGQKSFHLFGHCLGGNLALALATLQPHGCRSLILCSTPWDFHAGDATIGALARLIWQHGVSASSDGLVPPIVLQSLFTLLQPMQVTGKFRDLGRGSPTPLKMQHFTRVERWLNDGVALARPVLEEILRDWYGANLPVRGGWRVGAQPIKPQDISLPCLVAMPQHDHIVPPASAAALAQQLPCALAYPVPLGHIGMIISRHARETTWQRFADWIKDTP